MLENITDRFASFAADMLLPDQCAICGCSLFSYRVSKHFRIPLCPDCFETAGNSLFSNKFPGIKRCTACGYPLTSENILCSRCREKHWNFSSSTSLFIYTESGRQLITAYKFSCRKNLAYYFAGQICRFHKENCPERTVVPVPFRPSAKRKRGWDCMENICLILSRHYDIPVGSCLKRKNGPAQKTMSFSDRMSNLQNNISIKTGERAPEKVLLIDDVFTTGATMDYCAEILINAGAEDVRCLSIALDL